MSFVNVTPDIVGRAAGDLERIGSELISANVAAMAPTAGVTTAAADEVSVAIAALFGAHAEQFQAISGQAATFHSQFVSILNTGVGSYLRTEAANAGGGLSVASTAAGILGPYQHLVANTSANLQAISNTWTNQTAPILLQTITGYPQLIRTSLQSGNLLQLLNIPTDLALGYSKFVSALTLPVSVSITSLNPLDLSVGLGLQGTLILDALGAPVNAFAAAANSASAVANALAAGNSQAAFTALVDAPASIADGLLNGQETLPLNLRLAGLSITGDVPFGGLLVPLQPLEVTITTPGIPLVGTIALTGASVGGLVPGVVEYLPELLADDFAP